MTSRPLTLALRAIAYIYKRARAYTRVNMSSGEKSKNGGNASFPSSSYHNKDYQHLLLNLAGRTRSSEAAQRKVIDDATRKRRRKKQLEVLESDNFHDDPHNSLAQLSSKAKLPTFAETSDGEGEIDVYPLCYAYTISLSICGYC